MRGKVEEFLMTTFNEPITYSALAHLYVARGAVLCLPWWSWPGFGGWYLPANLICIADIVNSMMLR